LKGKIMLRIPKSIEEKAVKAARFIGENRSEISHVENMGKINEYGLCEKVRIQLYNGETKEFSLR
jgi:hypothetical protein